jgi:hypothetical protein
VRCRLILICIILIAPPLVAPFSSAPTVAVTADEIRELEAFQGYLEEAPGGLDIRYAWSLPGGRGENIRIIDIEISWNRKHNDLAHAASEPFVFVRGVDPQPQVNVDHGTAVLGMLVAAPDGVGITGIAHRAQVGLINPHVDANTLRVAQAVRRATDNLRPGDVMLIEQQSFTGPRFDFRTGRGLLPIEFEPEVFEAIKDATSRGIIVIEPAGNGSENLDDSIYNGVFDRARRDSGAIMVGSGKPPAGLYGDGPDRVRLPESNYGSRLDVQGWGRFVTTCGYGDLRHEQGENNWYTINFGATSAGAAMVAGAVAVLQSILIERRLTPLTPAQMRRLLVSTGSPQTGDVGEKIGPRPDLRAAIAELEGGDESGDPEITGVKLKGSSGKLIVDGSNFIPGESLIEIDGTPIERLKYPGSHRLPDGTATRIMTKKSVIDLLPPDVEVSVTVFTPASGKRSEPKAFRR